MIVQGLRELDVFSCEKYSVFTNLLYNSDFKDYVIVHTSVLPSSHVESSFISDKIFRSCLFDSVIKLAKFTSFDVIVALTCEFAVAEHQTLVRILYLFDLEM